tara:strand:+ start:1490 stop:1762 length:273 start_codon:yes stop_codon:yes gene_type:complete
MVTMHKIFDYRLLISSCSLLALGVFSVINPEQINQLATSNSASLVRDIISIAWGWPLLSLSTFISIALLLRGKKGLTSSSKYGIETINII